MLTQNDKQICWNIHTYIYKLQMHRTRLCKLTRPRNSTVCSPFPLDAFDISINWPFRRFFFYKLDADRNVIYSGQQKPLPGKQFFRIVNKLENKSCNLTNELGLLWLILGSDKRQCRRTMAIVRFWCIEFMIGARVQRVALLVIWSTARPMLQRMPNDIQNPTLLSSASWKRVVHREHG